MITAISKSISLEANSTNSLNANHEDVATSRTKLRYLVNILLLWSFMIAPNHSVRLPLVLQHNSNSQFYAGTGFTLLNKNTGE